MKQVEVQIPKIFSPLLTSSYRNKFFYGGRAGGKSYAFADCLLILGRQKKLFIACLREIQNSMKDSVYKLLCDRISFYGLDDYAVTDAKIENKITGTRFVFKGLRNQDSQKIKSLEGVDIAWIEEAQTITRKSWSILEPTIRKDGSEIWISMNREEENDPLWVLVAANPDERTLVVKVNYYDNPFCPEEIKLQAKKCKETSLADYNHIWLGEPLAQGDYKLINSELIQKARVAKISSSDSPLIIGLDIARSGSDRTVFCFRKGRYCFMLKEVRGFNTVQVADMATFFIKEYNPAKLFLDLGNSGAGVYDILIDRGYGRIVKGINFGGKAIMEDRYYNKRAEMWDSVNKWLQSELPVQIPDDDELAEELRSINRVKVAQDRLQLEDKEELKKRIGRSPDKADALALTFAEPVYDKGRVETYGSDYVCLEDLFRNATVKDNSW